MKRAYRLYLEIGSKDNWCMVHCPELPGMGFKAPSREIGIALAPLRLKAELLWAAAAGLEVGAAEDAGVDIIGAVTVDVPVSSGDTEAISGPEMTPLGDDYLALATAYMMASRKTLLDILKRLPEPALAWRPSRGKRSPAEIAQHVADGEAFYAVRLETPETVTKDLWEHYANSKLPVLERLAKSRELVLERLSGLSDDDRARTSRHDPHSETWTARKVLRRLAWHERYHTRQIETYLTS